MKHILLCSLFLITCLHGNLSDHFKKVQIDKLKKSPIEGIDYIYLLNLDQRPEKLEKTLNKLEPYAINPYRFPAIYGWDLSSEELNDIGLKFTSQMNPSKWVWTYPPEKEGQPEYEFLREAICGKTCYSNEMTPGAIGYTLSQLSILQNAYDAGFETIWILEDDVAVEQGPAVLSTLLKKLDKVVGKNGWDILFTDVDKINQISYSAKGDFEVDLKGELQSFYRPDINLSDTSKYAKRTTLSEDFVKIGMRMHTPSMIVRRSGIKKILDFEKKHRPFVPYERELAIIPGLNLINLNYNVVTATPNRTDLQVDLFSRKKRWKAYKEQTLGHLSNILGWRDPNKAHKIMDLIYAVKPAMIVEIGAFGGAVTYPIAKALSFTNSGVIYAIDAWDCSAAIEGLTSEKDVAWWKSLDFNAIKNSFQNLLTTNQIDSYCHPIAKLSKDAVSTFANESIDILLIDGNPSKDGVLSDVTLYLPKVKKGGYICLTNAEDQEKHPAILTLLKECKWEKAHSNGGAFAVFRKDGGPRAK